MQATLTEVRLSRRESQVLTELCRGLTNEEVGARLGISIGTVRVYRKRFHERLGAHDLIQAALVAWKRGLLDLDALAEEALARSEAELDAIPPRPPKPNKTLILPSKPQDPLAFRETPATMRLPQDAD